MGWVQIVIFCAVLLAIVPLLGGYMARVFTYEARRPQSWQGYAFSVITFSLLSWLFLYVVLRARMPWDLSFNTT
jgi:K+-transporting ATPase ATPase A chain